jgi:hypothetical protein
MIFYEPGNRISIKLSLRRTLVHLCVNRQSKIESKFKTYNFRVTIFDAAHCSERTSEFTIHRDR